MRGQTQTVILIAVLVVAILGLWFIFKGPGMAIRMQEPKVEAPIELVQLDITSSAPPVEKIVEPDKPYKLEFNRDYEIAPLWSNPFPFSVAIDPDGSVKARTAGSFFDIYVDIPFPVTPEVTGSVEKIDKNGATLKFNPVILEPLPPEPFHEERYPDEPTG